VVAAKVRFGFGFGLHGDISKAKAGGPRKSIPADLEGEEESPSSRKEARYEGLGLGKPRGSQQCKHRSSSIYIRT
jgi:mitosis inhibitor protein kinase SWE1